MGDIVRFTCKSLSSSVLWTFYEGLLPDNAYFYSKNQDISPVILHFLVLFDIQYQHSGLYNCIRLPYNVTIGNAKLMVIG